MAAAVAEGWVVSVPDHEGRDGMWGTPHEPGYRVLDGLRATLNFERFGLADDSRVGLWGYSGGGLASAWAAEVHADYAPELNIVGAVLGSPVGDLGNTFRRLNGTQVRRHYPLWWWRRWPRPTPTSTGSSRRTPPNPVGRCCAGWSA